MIPWLARASNKVVKIDSLPNEGQGDRKGRPYHIRLCPAPPISGRSVRFSTSIGITPPHPLVVIND